MLAITNNFDSFIVMYNNPKIIPTITKKPNKAKVKSEIFGALERKEINAVITEYIKFKGLKILFAFFVFSF